MNLAGQQFFSCCAPTLHDIARPLNGAQDATVQIFCHLERTQFIRPAASVRVLNSGNLGPAEALGGAQPVAASDDAPARCRSIPVSPHPDWRQQWFDGQPDGEAFNRRIVDQADVKSGIQFADIFDRQRNGPPR